MVSHRSLADAIVDGRAKGNVKLSVRKTFRHEGVEVQLHAFVTPFFDAVCGQIYAWVPVHYFGEIACGAN
jgi:hypothetical protein